MEYNSLHKSIAENIALETFRKKTEQYFNPICGWTVSDIEFTIKDELIGFIKENAIDIIIKDIFISGSRSRGIENNNSDLDIVITYEGNYSAYSLANLLNSTDKTWLSNIIKVDFNPIIVDENGLLEKYLNITENYLLSVSLKQ